MPAASEPSSSPWGRMLQLPAEDGAIGYTQGSIQDWGRLCTSKHRSKTKLHLFVCIYSAMWDPAIMAVLLRASQLCSQLSRVNVGMELSHRTQHHHLRLHTITWLHHWSSWMTLKTPWLKGIWCTKSLWHLHFELILVELEQEVWQSPLEESRRTQHQNQV